jgi:hypothetical protein
VSGREYDNTNRGVLFKNAKKESDRHADYRGNINIDGKEFWLDAWIKRSKDGKTTFMSLSVKPKMAREHQGATDNPPARYADKGGDPF